MTFLQFFLMGKTTFNCLEFFQNFEVLQLVSMRNWTFKKTALKVMWMSHFTIFHYEIWWTYAKHI